MEEEKDEVEVTPAMIEAGLEELRQHSFGEELPYLLECVYRAMAYEALAPASVTSASK